MKNTFLITSKDLDKLNHNLTVDLYIAEKMKEKATEILGEETKSYRAYQAGFMGVLTEDIQNEKAKHLIYVLNTIGEYKLDEGEDQIKKQINGMYHYPEFNVVVAQFENPYGYSGSRYIYGCNDEEVKTFFSYIKKRAKEREYENVTVLTDTRNGAEEHVEKITKMMTREQVFLDEGIKKAIYRTIDSFFNEEQSFYKEFNLPYKRGILLYGPPGNGKTTLVKSIASTVKAPVMYYQITEFTTSETIQDVFSQAANLAPMILVIEDVDSMPKDSRSAFLNILDGATSKEGIFLIGTTNYPERVDEALINRAGRFDKTYEIQLPNDKIRRAFLSHTKLKDILSDKFIEMIVEKTKGFSLAQLHELYSHLALNWHYDKDAKIDEVLKEMTDTNQKQKKNTWKKEEQVSPLGFTK